MQVRVVFRKVLPYLVAVVVFFAVSALYFAPQYAGETLSQTDVTMYGGMKADISQHRAAYDEDPQWTGGMFGGMPAYLITVQYPAMFLRNAAQEVMNVIGEPAALMFLAMLGFWLMLLMCGVNVWLAIPMALAYGLSTYNILIIEAGHITKMRAMGWAPMLVGAVVMTFRRQRPWLGGGLAALFGALLIAASHHQVTYYFLLVVVAFWVGKLCCTIIDKEGWRRFLKATGVLVAAGVLAVGANFTHLWYTFEHSPETIRGGSELATDNSVPATEDKKPQGLDLQYATAWSYGIGESVNMFIPNARGGASGGFSEDGPVVEALRKAGYPPREAVEVATQLLPAYGATTYWGDQPFTGGPTYLGAVVVFLCVLGLFILPGRKKWWIVGVSLLALFLAWGSNMMWFTRLGFAVLPGLDKFRTVSMALVVLQWSVPFVAALGLAEMWRFSRQGIDGYSVTCDANDRACGTPLSCERLIRGLKWSLGIVGGVALFFALFGGLLFDFSTAADAQFSDFPGLADAMRVERAALLKADSWRSLVFVGLAAGIVWIYIRKFGPNSTPLPVGSTPARKSGKWLLVTALSVLVLADLVPVDRRFVSWDDFREPAHTKVEANDADRAILEDKEPGYRVFNTQNPFNEAYTSYFHRSIGGYHGAKLRRYQDVIDGYLSQFDLEVLNLLNAKYFIVADPKTDLRTVELNPDANGAAWFVEEVVFADGAREEFEALATIDNKVQAVVSSDYARLLADYQGRVVDDYGRDIFADSHGSRGTIELVEYRPNYLKYSSLSSDEELAVFSEIYYDKGWTAYVDGVRADYFRVDYLLRGMVVPPGEHTIEWRFRAPRFAAVEGVTLAAGVLILGWLAVALLLRRRKTESAPSNEDN